MMIDSIGSNLVLLSLLLQTTTLTKHSIKKQGLRTNHNLILVLETVTRISFSQGTLQLSLGRASIRNQIGIFHGAMHTKIQDIRAKINTAAETIHMLGRVSDKKLQVESSPFQGKTRRNSRRLDLSIKLVGLRQLKGITLCETAI